MGENRRIIGIIVVILMIVALGGVTFFSYKIYQYEQELKDMTTDTWSSELSGKSEKIDFLQRYVRCATIPTDTEFRIVYKDNAQQENPKPADFEISVILKFKPEFTEQWLEGLEKIPADMIDMRWWSGLIGLNPNLAVSGDFECYKRPDSTQYTVLFPNESVIYKYAVSGNISEE